MVYLNENEDTPNNKFTLHLVIHSCTNEGASDNEKEISGRMVKIVAL